MTETPTLTPSQTRAFLLLPADGSYYEPPTLTLWTHLESLRLAFPNLLDNRHPRKLVYYNLQPEGVALRQQMDSATTNDPNPHA